MLFQVKPKISSANPCLPTQEIDKAYTLGPPRPFPHNAPTFTRHWGHFRGRLPSFLPSFALLPISLFLHGRGRLHSRLVSSQSIHLSMPSPELIGSLKLGNV